MTRLLVVAVLLGALAIPVAAPGAVLEKGAGATCASGVGTWNFVNNKTEGAAAGTLTVFFDTEEFGVIQFGPVGPTVANKSVQKFTLFTNNVVHRSRRSRRRRSRSLISRRSGPWSAGSSGSPPRSSTTPTGCGRTSPA